MKLLQALLKAIEGGHLDFQSRVVQTEDFFASEDFQIDTDFFELFALVFVILVV